MKKEKKMQQLQEKILSLDFVFKPSSTFLSEEEGLKREDRRSIVWMWKKMARRVKTRARGEKSEREKERRKTGTREREKETSFFFIFFSRGLRKKHEKGKNHMNPSQALRLSTSP